MATDFPTDLDDFTNPTGSDDLDSPGVEHADQHANLNDAVEAIEAKVGIDASGDATSLDYLVSHIATSQIINDAVTYAKIQNVSTNDRLLGRQTSGAGNIEELLVTGGLEFTGGGILRSALTGDVTASTGGTSTAIASGVVTYAKMQDVSVTDRLLGRDTAGTGDVEEISVSGGLEFSGSGSIRLSALSGDVTSTAGSSTTTIANSAVTLAKMANIATDHLIGRDTAGTGAPEAITVGGGLEFTTSGGIQRSALSGGDVTSSAGSAVLTIPNNTVTYAKMQDVSATARIMGRNTAGSGDMEELSAATVLSMLSVSTTSAVVLQTLADAKGDIIGGTAADTWGKLTVGINDTILMAASAQTTGLKWATPLEVRTAIGIPATYAADIGTGAATAITKTHNLGTRDVVVEVYRNSTPWDTVLCDVTRPNGNDVTLTFAVAPTTNEYRLVVRA